MAEILLIEDNPADVYLLRRALTAVAPEVGLRIMEDGLAAARYLRGQDGSSSSELPRLVVMDLNLPGLPGEELVRLLRRGPLRDVPVIVMTTSDQEEDRVRSLRAGADLFVTKPPRYRRLEELVRGWVARFVVCHPAVDCSAA